MAASGEPVCRCGGYCGCGSPDLSNYTPLASRIGTPPQTVSNFEMLMQFHAAFDLAFPLAPTMPDPGLFELRYNLIKEELEELKDAYEAGDFVEIADAIGDILYTAYGAGVSFGINADRVFAEVHRSNMTKLGPNGEVLKDANGKVTKGPNYEEPDLSFVLEGML